MLLSLLRLAGAKVRVAEMAMELMAETHVGVLRLHVLEREDR